MAENTGKRTIESTKWSTTNAFLIKKWYRSDWQWRKSCELLKISNLTVLMDANNFSGINGTIAARTIGRQYYIHCSAHLQWKQNAVYFGIDDVITKPGFMQVFYS
jgi:hypothetical protein